MTASQSHAVEIRQVRNGHEIVNAPNAVVFSDGIVSGEISTGIPIEVRRGVVTLRGIGRTVCYRLRKQSQDDRALGVHTTHKIYDDWDAKEPV